MVENIRFAFWNLESFLSPKNVAHAVKRHAQHHRQSLQNIYKIQTCLQLFTGIARILSLEIIAYVYQFNCW